jgi:signal transduction histidine kinase
MRQLLDVLRVDDRAAELQPPPGLSRLETLVQDFRAAGLDVSLSVQGDPPNLGPLQDLCCYRLIEEALSNVTRHSLATRACVWIDVDDRHIDVGVQDPGPPRPDSGGTGRGLVGLRERVELCGGVLTAGPTHPGFSVRTSIPRMAR